MVKREAVGDDPVVSEQRYGHRRTRVSEFNEPDEQRLLDDVVDDLDMPGAGLSSWGAAQKPGTHPALEEWDDESGAEDHDDNDDDGPMILAW
ncbi:hypothetical protein [Phytoactinopolyspora halotolerans]|uniref:Uncharacterized protein n=1 Tax=Phytoactinopolyspora halotolerans TaxID=1981512 RepID=A0A6L9SF80_9ACTN|nr:hypothetical protein [Phytoactinopolyspora halotolerans]NEE03759.1 hypothetical protein [Phytoactinopolyspora halotolerans]